MAELNHVHGACRVRLQALALECGPVHREGVEGLPQGAAPGPIERADQGRKADDGADRLSAVGVSLQAVADSQERRAGLTVRSGQFPDRLGRHTGDLGGALRRESGRLVSVRVETDRVASNEAVVEEVFPDQNVRDRQCQCGVRPRARHEVGVGQPRGAGSIGVNHDQTSTVAPGLGDETHPMNVGVDGVDPPQDQKVRTDGALEVAPDAGAVGGEPGLLGGRVADGAEQARRAQPVKKRVTGLARDEPHVPAVGIGEDRFGSPPGGDRRQAAGDLVQCLVPRDANESSLALLSDPAQRVQDTVRRVDAFGVPMHLMAEEPLGEGMVGVAVAGNDAPLLDRGRNAARVGAVVGTDGFVR